MLQGLDTYMPSTRIAPYDMNKHQKSLLNTYRTQAKVKKRATAPSAEEAFLNWENGKPLPLACSNPDRLQEYVFGKMVLTSIRGDF
jgi:hypothetical protein